jgi:hypothetical protein
VNGGGGRAKYLRILSKIKIKIFLRIPYSILEFGSHAKVVIQNFFFQIKKTYKYKIIYLNHSFFCLAIFNFSHAKKKTRIPEKYLDAVRDKKLPEI